MHIVKEVLDNSIAQELDIVPGDCLISINGEEIKDIFDYQFLINDSYIEMLITKADGEEWELEIEKDDNEDLGLVFENGLMDEYRSCKNKCIFCFVDQMPEGMRDTLYFKDDDARLSFLQGNYITLTNMKKEDLERIVRYHMEPINISVHTTNKELRCKMLHNRFAGEALDKIDYLYKNQIEMNGQIVLCKGYNDGEELERSIKDLGKYCPIMKSVSVVPVGLTKFREGLCPLEAFSSDEAREVVRVIEAYQKIFYEKYGLHFIHASDEFYILAGLPLPSSDTYDGYLQLENGVGMIRLLMDEVEEALASHTGDSRENKVSIATGILAEPYLEKCKKVLQNKYPNIQINIYPIINEYFGTSITVAGLITGTDLIKQLQDKDLGNYLLIPLPMLRSGEDVFLDDMHISDIQKALQVPVISVKSSGQALIESILNKEGLDADKKYQAYELS